MKRKRILVPVDGRASSLDAIEAAAQLGPAEIVLLHVVEPYDAIVPEQLYAGLGGRRSLLDEEKARVREWLERMASCVRPRRITARTELRVGDAWEEIVDAARSLHADMIVMTTAGRHGLPRFLLGSVTEKVIRAAECPVLSLRAAPRDASDTQSSAGTIRDSRTSKGSRRPAVVSTRRKRSAGSSSGGENEPRRSR